MVNKSVTHRSGDLISRDALLQEINAAVYYGQCYGLMDVLDIIHSAPAVNCETAENCGTCNDKRPYCPTDCPTAYVTRAKISRS